MTDPRSILKFTFTWQNMADACPQCTALGGKSWSEQDIYQHTLYDVVWGDVWNLETDTPMTHGGTGANCRCQLQVRVDVDPAAWEEIQSLYGSVQEYLAVAYPATGATASSYSAGEITDLSTVTEMKQQLSGLEETISRVNIRSRETELSLRQEVRILTLAMNLIVQMSNNPDVDAFTLKLQRGIMVAMQARMAFLALQAAMIPGAGLGALLYGGALGVSFVMSASDYAMTLGE